MLLALAGPAMADPGYCVVTAYDPAGRVGAELRYWTAKSPDEKAAWLWGRIHGRRGDMFTMQLQWLR
ncbi:hypothetical protein J2X20_005615 [Pelomonas saccharophila]|uniref:Uncharacterized protein n=1 Tax=Roseateles saccharophilus TaxID=304 RepID=A0ABU1YXE1_ROSSA|nr:hypothetical protein [Roseateles saccharophilus]MDR7272930.1 hypothetical protein [Roseateles saccharophilus]